MLKHRFKLVGELVCVRGENGIRPYPGFIDICPIGKATVVFVITSFSFHPNLAAMACMIYYSAAFYLCVVNSGTQVWD